MQWALKSRDSRNAIWEWLESPDGYLIWKHRTHDGRFRYGLECADARGQWEVLSGHDSSAEAKAAAEEDLRTRLAEVRKRRHVA